MTNGHGEPRRQSEIDTEATRSIRNKFKQMEEDAKKVHIPTGPPPCRQLTPPPCYSGGESDDYDESDYSEDDYSDDDDSFRQESLMPRVKKFTDDVLADVSQIS